MKRSSPLWGSVSVLIGVVIAILALVRGAWLVPLLLLTFTAWGLWVVMFQLHPPPLKPKTLPATPPSPPSPAPAPPPYAGRHRMHPACMVLKNMTMRTFRSTATGISLVIS